MGNKFMPGDRVRAITKEEGVPYDLKFQNKLATIIRYAGDGLYWMDFDEIPPPSSFPEPGDPKAYWRGRAGGVVLVPDDADLQPLRLEFELACALGKLFKEVA